MMEREIEIIRQTVSILDSVDYKRYSDGKASAYLEYASGAWIDERRLIAPILFPKLLEQVLGFKLGETIGTQEAMADARDTPDYIPVDTRTHPFLFDCKGMDTADLSKWYDQIKRYLEIDNLKYGILVNMRNLGVFTPESSEQVEAFKFSFVELYRAMKEAPAGILGQENTKRFLTFVKSFRYTPLTVQQKLRRAAEAKQWTGKEPLNIELLTKRLHYVVERIYEDVSSRKEELFSLKETEPERAIAIAQEVETLASEIERGRKIEGATLQTFDEILDAPPSSLLGRALDLFFFRIGYFTMTRLLLARTWEDIGFIEPTLYNGGLARWYENFNREIRRVLKYAFQLAAERYKWLFNVDNNYTWYEPSDETLIEALYELSNFYLGKLNQDVLGSIYEEYIDKVDKRQKGQYYTPRELVEFIWDRVGFVKDEDFFTYREGKREPRLIFDPATGSGGFLVEAVRRMREDSKINYDDFNDVLDLRTSILTGVFGSEISPFPYYITEVNLLVQLTPVIKRMMEMQKGFAGKGTPALGIVPVDALSLYNPEQLALEQEQYDFDQTRELLPIEDQKRTIFQKTKRTLDARFTYCCANPPYVGEKGNKELFRATLARFPYWRNFYQGKMDYLYFFIILGLSKLQEGGKLGFITTAYWPTADGASILRSYVLKNARIREIIFFDDVKIFEYARGQHNMVFILEKCSGAEKDANSIKIVRVLASHREVPGNTIREKLGFLARHIEEHIEEDEWEDEYISVFCSAMKQGNLTDEAWHLTQVSNLDKILERLRQTGVPLDAVCNVIKGVDTGSNKVTRENIRLATDPTVGLGQGIFVLSGAEFAALALSHGEENLVKRLITSEDLGNGIIDPASEHMFLIYVTDKDHITSKPRLLDHLSRFRGILESRAEVVRNPSRKWFSLAWPRAGSIFEGEKLIVSYRAEHNNFVYDNEAFYGLSGLYFVAKRDGVDENLRYVEALLNSKLLDFWYEYKGKKKGNSREYVETPMKSIPIRRIDFGNPEDVRLHDEIVQNVKSIREKMGELVGHSKYFKGIRLARLKSDDSLPDFDLEAIVQSLAPESRFSLRTHPGVKVRYEPDLQEAEFILNKVGETSLGLEGAELKLYGKGKRAVFIGGEERLLKIIAGILKSHAGERWASVKEMPLIPRNPEEFADDKRRILEAVSRLRTEIQNLQESIDVTVCELYGVSGDLTV